MSYTVLARRYRSQSFAELIGQETIARTLASAIEQDRVAHAYLFTGTRGVGKTSTARLFANAINNPKNDPDILKAIMNGQDTDVIEIDAASNTSVDNARELIANSVYRPMRGRSKIYIIDEVHMLSMAAFNALLKTMEEPPAHIVFILCTTETHKVPATIQSRCQRFDFRNIPVPEIVKHLRHVVDDEKAKADDDLLHMLARLANGSMRDALSLLDRLLAADKKKLTLELLESLLGLPDRTILAQLVAALGSGDPAAALARAGDLLARGISPEQLLSSLADRFRDLLVLATCGPKTDLVELTPDARAAAIDEASRFDPAGLVHMIALCESVARNSRSCSFPRALIDALIVRLALTDRIADATAIVTSTPRPRHPRRSIPGKKTLTAAPAPAAPPTPGFSTPSQREGVGGWVSAPSESPRTPVDSTNPTSIWSALLAAETRPGVHALMEHMHLRSISNDRATLACDPAFLDSARQLAAKPIAEHLARILARPTQVFIEPDPSLAATSTAPRATEVGSATSVSSNTPPDPAAGAAARSHPLVQRAVDLLGARIVRVQPRR